WRLTDSPVELIPDYPALLAWSERRETLPTRAVARLRAQAARRTEADVIVREAHLPRGQIWAIAEDLIARRRARLSALNRQLAELPSEPGLCFQGGRYVFELDGANLRQPLWPVLWSLTAVLASEDAARVGSARRRAAAGTSSMRAPATPGCGARAGSAATASGSAGPTLGVARRPDLHQASIAVPLRIESIACQNGGHGCFLFLARPIQQ